MKLAVIIVTFNNAQTIQRCLESVLENVYLNVYARIHFHIHVIDNASTDGTLSVIKNIPLISDLDLRISENSANLGFSTAINQGIKLAQGKDAPDYFLLLNPDAYLDKNCISELLNPIHHSSSSPQHCLSSPKIINPRTNQPWFEGGKIDWLRMRTKHLSSGCQLSNVNCQVSYLSGCCLLIPRKIIKKIGLLDERFFLYYEDADYSLRVQKAGFKLKIIPQAVCYHSESHSFGFADQESSKNITIQQHNNTKNYHLVLSALLFFHKHLPFFAQPYFWLVFSLRLIHHRFISKKPDILKAFRDFIEIKN